MNRVRRASTISVTRITAPSHRYSKARGKICFCVTLFGWLQTRKSQVPIELQSFGLSLPTDDEGLCLFHSKQRSWKIAHKANEQFKNLIKLSSWAEHNGFKDSAYLDATEFQFAGELNQTMRETGDPALAQTPIIDLSDMKFTQSTLLAGAKFWDDTWFSYSEFPFGITFADVHLEKEVHFHNAQFDRQALFTSSHFCGPVSFLHSAFVIADFNRSYHSSNW